MRRSVAVHLDALDAPVGTLRYDRDGRREHAAFSYTDWRLAHAERFAIEPSLPLVAGFQFAASREQSVFPGAIADCAPDGWGRRVILRDHAKRRQAARAAGEASRLEPLDELDFLLAVDDESRIGALRFRDEQGDYQERARTAHGAPRRCSSSSSSSPRRGPSSSTRRRPRTSRTCGAAARRWGASVRPHRAVIDGSNRRWLTPARRDGVRPQQTHDAQAQLGTSSLSVCDANAPEAGPRGGNWRRGPR